MALHPVPAAAPDGLVTLDLTRALLRAARSWHAQPDEAGLLHAVLTDVAALVPAAVAVSLRSTGSRAAPVLATSLAAAELDRWQQREGEGPLVLALAGAVSVVPDLRDAPRWPRLAPRAARHGVRTVLSLPLDTGRKVLGALTLYAPGPGPDQRALLLEAAAGHAALALQSVRQVAHLTSAVGSRDVIGQAKGVLMERYRITADAAFGILAQASQDAHRKLRDVAQQVTETGETPPLRGGPPQR